MRSACLSLLLVTACWSLPFHLSGLPEGPKCPFRCQCHLRVVQCSDLGLKSVPDEIPAESTLLDLQNNKITEIKENDFKTLKGLQTLILVNNQITTIHPKAFIPLGKLQRLYLSKNLLKEMPANMPKSLQQLCIRENKITEIKKATFEGMAQVIVMGIDQISVQILLEIFQILCALALVCLDCLNDKSVFLCWMHNELNPSPFVSFPLFFLSSFSHLLGLSYNEISQVENGSLAMVPHLRELHLDNNALTTVPAGLPDHKYIQVIYLHSNKIGVVGTQDFCPPGYNTKKAMYSGISLFSNPVPYWEVQPITFRCVFDRSAIQLGNYRKK
uniref:Decorin n=1 Tax=Hucho hucho TaxID=62062 RepID=A0A4W5K3S0_9TELE